jgi:hypothetical protein
MTGCPARSVISHYVSKQLGHSDVSVTARHYARWVDDDAYRRPMAVEEGEVPADLLARLPVNLATVRVAEERGQ